jgi:hypothetical protein
VAGGSFSAPPRRSGLSTTTTTTTTTAHDDDIDDDVSVRTHATSIVNRTISVGETRIGHREKRVRECEKDTSSLDK